MTKRDFELLVNLQKKYRKIYNNGLGGICGISDSYIQLNNKEFYKNNPGCELIEKPLGEKYPNLYELSYIIDGVKVLTLVEK